jgi:cathepsin C
MFLESYYTVSENDAKYQAATGVFECKKYEGLEPVAKVEEAYYVAGAYGMMSEELLMKELYARGPVLYDFNAGYDFMTYSSGVLMEQSNPHGITDQDVADDDACPSCLSDLTQDGQGVLYQKLTHSTLLVGWGEENGIPYWKVRNSYGGNWGDNGYFKVRRGLNDYGGEGENSAHIPECFTCQNDRAD